MNLERQPHNDRPPHVQDAILKINNSDAGIENVRNMGKKGGEATAKKRREEKRKAEQEEAARKEYHLRESRKMMDQANEFIVPLDQRDE